MERSIKILRKKYFSFIANANAEIDNLQQELIKKVDDSTKQQDEILQLSNDVKSNKL